MLEIPSIIDAKKPNWRCHIDILKIHNSICNWIEKFPFFVVIQFGLVLIRAMLYDAKNSSKSSMIGAESL